MKFKKALVTGGAGFIGSHLVDRLVDLDIETVVVDDLSMGNARNVSEKAEFIKADILDYKKLNKAMRGVDIVFHQAARVSIRNSVENFSDDANVNIMGTVNVLKAMVENKARKIVYASSMAVYGINKLPIREGGILEPASPYGVGKLASEKYCFLMGKFNKFDVAVLRYFNTYGPRQTLTPYVGVITIFINRLLDNKPPLIFGNGEQVRDFIYVEDIVEANIRAMQKDNRCIVANVGTGRGTSVNQVARILINKISPLIKPRYAEPRPEEPASSIADTKQAKRILGFKARYNLKDKIGDVINWIRRK